MSFLNICLTLLICPRADIQDDAVLIMWSLNESLLSNTTLRLWTEASKLSQKEIHLLWSPSHFFYSSFGNWTWIFLRTDEEKFDVEAEGGEEFLLMWTPLADVLSDTFASVFTSEHTTFNDRAFSMLAIANWTFYFSKSARSISPLISSSATRSRISASSCQRVLSFCCRLSLCCFSLILCSHTWEMSPTPRTSITDKIIHFALDLRPACCRHFAASSSAITQHNFTHIRYVESAFIRLTMDHEDEFELYFTPRIVRLNS